MKNITKTTTVVLILALSLSVGCITKEPFVPAGEITIDKISYMPGETVSITWSNLNFLDKVVISNQEGSIETTYTPKPPSGSLTYQIPDGNATTGAWKVTLYFGHDIVDQKRFSVD